MLVNNANVLGNSSEDFYSRGIENNNSCLKPVRTFLPEAWLAWAEKYESNELSSEKSSEILKEIYSGISLIKDMVEDKKLVYQSFVSKIALFSPMEKECFTKFLKETHNFDFQNLHSNEKKYYFFDAFMKLCETLKVSNAEIESEDQRVFDQIIKELEKYSYEVRLENTFSQIPDEALNTIFGDNPKKTEISRNFKIRSVWDEIKKNIRNMHFDKKLFLDIIAKNTLYCRDLGLDSHYLNYNVDAIELENHIKDEVLACLNQRGHLHLFFPNNLEKAWSNFDPKKIENLMIWLGKNRTSQIKKINIGVLENKSLLNLSFILPNLEGLQFYVGFFREFETTNIENIYMFSNLKELKLYFHDLNQLRNFLLFISNSNKLPKDFKLELNFPVQINNLSKDDCVKMFETIPAINNIGKLKISDSFKSSIIEDVCKVILPKFTDLYELDVDYRGKMFVLESNLKNLKKLSIANEISYNLAEIMQIFPNLEHFFVNNQEIPLSEDRVEEVQINNIQADQKIIKRFLEKKPLFVNNREIPLYEDRGKKIQNTNNIKADQKIIKRFLEKKPLFVNNREVSLSEDRVEDISNPPLATRVKQIGAFALTSLGVYSLLKSTATSPLPISTNLGLSTYEPIEMVAAVSFFVLGAAAVAYYYKSYNKNQSVKKNFKILH